MKRLLTLATLACAACLLAIAGPALSVRPYRAKPVDFSVSPPPGASASKSPAHPRALTSRPRRTSKRFNMVGLTFRPTGRQVRIAVRTRKQGEPWRAWNDVSPYPGDGPDPNRGEPATAGSSTPDWVGEADWVQYRSSHPLPRLRLRFINVRGTATAADRARNAVRRVANAGLVSVAGLAGGAVAKAGGAQPGIVRRADWGASSCVPRTGPEYGEVKAAFVHHTVNANDYTRDEAPDVVLAICRFHRNSNGWNDIGYNFLVDRFGTIYEGRAGGIDKAVVGAQAQGYNAQSTGIANIGTFESVGQTPQALDAMARLIRWKLPLHGTPTTGTTTLVSAGGSENRYPAGQRLTRQRVIGHRDTGATSCPGNALYAQLPRLRSLVGDIRPGGVTTRVTAKVRARGSTVTYGATSAVTGAVTADGAAPNASLPVQVQAFVGARWRTVANAATDRAGHFAAAIKPTRTRSLRARFPGQSGLRAASSRIVRVAVRPIVTVTGRPMRGRAGVAAKIRGKVRPRRTFVWQVLQAKKGSRWKIVGRRKVKTTRKGTFSSFFVPSAAGRYRFYVVALKDSAYARGVTPLYSVKVARGRAGGGAGS